MNVALARGRGAGLRVLRAALLVPTACVCLALLPGAAAEEAKRQRPSEEPQPAEVKETAQPVATASRPASMKALVLSPTTALE